MRLARGGCRDPDEIRKREQAITLLDEDRGALSVQVLQEFYVQATRASRPDPNTAPDRRRSNSYLDALCGAGRYGLDILTQALEIKVNHGFSYWDSAIIAAARALRCRQLYSEDMVPGRDVEGVVILNPFR